MHLNWPLILRIENVSSRQCTLGTEFKGGNALHLENWRMKQLVLALEEFGGQFWTATSSQVFSRTLLRRRWGLWKHHQSRSRSVTREKTSLESFVKHICTARIFTQFHVFVKKKSFWKLTRMKKFCSTYWKGGGSLTNLLRIFSLVLERCTHCGRNSSTDCNGLLRFYSLVWGYKVSLSTFMRDISRHLGFMGCGLLVHYYIPKGVVVVQYAVYSPDIFLILHLLFPDFLCISTMRTKTKYCKKSFKRLPRFRLSKGDFL